MLESEWQKLQAKLETRLQPNWLPVSKPTEDDLNAFESMHGFKLPVSYRSFIKLFGAGRLAFDFKLLSPACSSPRYDMHAFNETTKGNFTPTFLGFYSDPEQVKRLVYFAIPEDADLIGWDPKDIRDAENHEYGIYELGPSDALRLIARSFPEFIDTVCLADPGNETDSRLVYQPAQIAPT